MKTSTLFSFLVFTLSTLHSTLAADTNSNITQEIVNNAAADDIDFSVINSEDVLNEIASLWSQIAQNTSITYSEYTSETSDTGTHATSHTSSSLLGSRPSLSDFLSGGKRIDVHSHVVPDWYRALVPVTGQNPTPSWDLSSHISFLSSESIDRAIIAFSAPAANVFQGNKLATIALARLMNEQVAAYSAAYPNKLKFYASLLGSRPSLSDFLSGGKRIDVHSHVVPDWYRALVPVTGQNPTPSWDLSSHISFLSSESIDRAIIAFSAPAANVFQGNKLATIALARLMNEQVAAYSAAYPNKLKFYAVVPLPYVQEAIAEAKYAFTKLGAAGIFLTSNFEGTYLGNTAFTPFFEAIDKMYGKKVLFIHPSTPFVKSDNRLIEANPTPYPTGNLEFYFETARTLVDLTLTQTIHNYTSIDYIIPHVGGAFPAAIDRILKSTPAIYDSSMKIYQTRFWWDSAGPTYYHQVSGLLGYNISESQLLFGTDYPYAPLFTQAGSLGAILSSPLLTDAERDALFSTNAGNTFAGVHE
ncbi:2-amino-3-carboxymuconate-6-semialdehyde decarboxylase [Leucoagaricus sp. SymC.cos]|nr:2-amino-3-carboxymuconate-6-semialdehyde decarboxylase [Leucoagaricus sp. SymC.cos]